MERPERKNCRVSLPARRAAHTLQVGRKSFECRAAIVARTAQELLDGLARVIEGRGGERVWSGHAKNSQSFARLFDPEEQRELIQLLTRRRDPRKLAQLWVEGVLADLRGFPCEAGARRTSLPTYPFARERYWLDARAAGEGLCGGTASLTSLPPSCARSGR